MKNIIKTLAISSILSMVTIPSFVNAKEIYNEDINPIVQEKGFKVKTISYKEEHSVQKWHKDLSEMFQYEYDPYAKAALTALPNVRYGTKEYGAVINYTKAQMLNKFWIQINTDFKDSKNAKVAFCKYTEDVGVISKSLRVCDKNYDFYNPNNLRISLVDADVLPKKEQISW